MDIDDKNKCQQVFSDRSSQTGAVRDVSPSGVGLKQAGAVASSSASETRRTVLQARRTPKGRGPNKSRSSGNGEPARVGKQFKQKTIVEALTGPRGTSAQRVDSSPEEQCDLSAPASESKQEGPIRKEVLSIEVKANGTGVPTTKCGACGMWGAPCRADKDSNTFVCNKRCWRRWWLEWVGKKSGVGVKRPIESVHETKGSGASPPSPPDTMCAGCGEKQVSHPCERCWGVWYCSHECRKNHWGVHQSQYGRISPFMLGLSVARHLLIRWRA